MGRLTYGSGSGYGDGDGDGYGSGDGDGDGDGSGSGSGDGDVEIDASTPIIAWHYVPRDGRLRYEHGGQRPAVAAGLVLTFGGDLSLCDAGLHASLLREDARGYCRGIPTRVACSGRIKWGADKFCCSRREVLEVLALDD